MIGQNRHVAGDVSVRRAVIGKSADFAPVTLNEQRRVADFHGRDAFAAVRRMTHDLHVQRQSGSRPLVRRHREIRADRADGQRPPRRQPHDVVDLLGRNFAIIAHIGGHRAVRGARRKHLVFSRAGPVHGVSFAQHQTLLEKFRAGSIPRRTAESPQTPRFCGVRV